MPPEYTLSLRVFSVFVFLGWFFFTLRFLIHGKSTGHLADFTDVLRNKNTPFLSIIIPARNEEEMIEEVLTRILAEEYDCFEVIVVNDGSADKTGTIATSLAERDQRLRVVHIDEPPGDWLGKPHACYRGYLISKGAYLLFTDADVIFKQGVIPRVMNYLIVNQPAHLTMFPGIITKSYLEASFMMLFAFLFLTRYDQRSASSRKKKGYIGIGAFNLVRRDIYERFGTHQALALEVADDVKLGLLVKSVGEKSDVLHSDGFISVRWRTGFFDTLKGLRRSIFPGTDFSLGWFIIGFIGTVLGLTSPYWLLFMPDAVIRLTSIGAVILIILVYYLIGRSTSSIKTGWILHPVMSVVFLLAYFESVVLYFIKGGVIWRDRFYSRKTLRKAKKSYTPSRFPH